MYKKKKNTQKNENKEIQDIINKQEYSSIQKIYNIYILQINTIHNILYIIVQINYIVIIYYI